MLEETQNILEVTQRIDLPEHFEKTGKVEVFKIWAIVAANDDTGLVISNVKKGDEIIIYDASGIASFKEANMHLISSIIGIANAIGEAGVLIATEGEAAPFIGAWNKGVDSIRKAIENGHPSHGNRDAYGRDPGTGDYAKEEGGLIVAMPESKGPIYATHDYFLKDGAKKNGRKVEYYSQKTLEKNAFFPYPDNGGKMSATAGIDGVVHILAFDSKFTDNHGAYAVAVYVVRNNVQQPKEMIRKLEDAPPSDIIFQ
ncbi:MAG TPA: hypothetical protein VK184_15320 [Nostocaceae cyanobacterium]|nr:hypothetical protein [Nostocaceae cyanobacterium]